MAINTKKSFSATAGKVASAKAKAEEPAVKMSNTLAFGAINYALVAVGFAIVVLGFILMAGDSSTVEQFNEDIFSPLRIQVAPAVTLFGFLFIIFGIAFSLPSFLKKNKKDQAAE